ncbi:MAG: anaerobic ribonucleoside-triphosphate reductase activating protein [Bacilli bacterium]|jgi:anaerobic ribonucleoside-triphosphate reductase activating protein|nr:anaerobic ribonucleoside-triphosphate reductase-activating protein [Firmicutes bacterium CAG:345]
MRIAGFVEESIVDGPGFRIVIFFQGCAHHCYGCHNPETWDFEGGKEVSFDLIKKIIDDNPYADGITLSGGDPLYQIDASTEIAEYAKSKGLDVILYTGFLFEEVLEMTKANQRLKDLLNNVDTLIDGPFILEQRHLSLKFRGSSNQRIIDVKKSLMQNKIVEKTL